MKYQVGDRVLVLLSNEEGEIVDILNDKMVMVDVRGVRFPAYMDQIDFPYFKRFSEKKLVPDKKPPKQYIDNVRKEKPLEKKDRKEEGVWLAFLPVTDTDEFGDEVVEQLKIHVINRTSRAFHFEYHVAYFGEADFRLKNELLPFTDFYLHDLPFEDMNDSPSFHFDFSLQQPHKDLADHYEASLRLKPKQFFSRFEQMRAKGEASFAYELFHDYPKAQTPEKFDLGALAAKGMKIYTAKDAKKHIPPARTVVDLHIEKLVDDPDSYSNSEMLDIQLREFEKWYEIAVLHKQPSLIIIHGVGTGRLRNEIHDQLRLKREVKSFVNQYHPSFGYGATEIFFQYV